MYAITISEKEARDLKESGEGLSGGLGGREGRNIVIQRRYLQ